MPEEIFQLWFDDRIRSNGWPPTSPSWRGALRDYPLSFWANLRWSNESLTLNQWRLTDDSWDIVAGLIDANFKGIDNVYSRTLNDSKPRIRSILEFIKANHRLPGTLIFIEDDGELELVDGCHRLATLAELKRSGMTDSTVSMQVDAWIGRIVND